MTAMTDALWDVAIGKTGRGWILLSQAVRPFSGALPDLYFQRQKKMKMQIPISDALILIRAHYEGEEDVFKEKCRQIADDLAERSNDEGSIQISHYIRGLIGDEPTWVPMDDEWVEVPPEK